MPAVTVQDLNNAKIDVDHIAEVANSTATTATDRLGHVKQTVLGAVQTLRAFNPRGARANGVTYNLKDIYTEGGFAYLAVTTSFVSTSLAADVATGNVVLYQGGVFTATPGGVTRSVDAKLQESAAVTDFGAVADNGSSSTSAVASASTARGLLKEFTSATFPNVTGADVSPMGVVHDRGKGRVFNPTQQRFARSFGQETLQFYFSRLGSGSNANAGNANVARVTFSGDSTTAFVGGTYMTIVPAMRDLALQRGYANIAAVDRGVPGASCQQWSETYVNSDLASNPDLLVLRWGANDPFFGVTVDQFITYLRNGLATLRAARSVSQMSIILMTPTSMNDVEKGRTEVWSEKIGPAIRQAARDFQCAFIDTFSTFQNSHDAAGVWMDSDTTFYPAGRAIHPRDILYEHICGLMADMMFPVYGYNWKNNSVRNPSATETSSVLTGTESPNSFFCGITMNRMGDPTGSPAGAPYNGMSITHKSADGIVSQLSLPLPGGAQGSGISHRFAFNGVWSIWYGQTKAASLSNGWTAAAGSATPQYQNSLEGRVFLNGVANKGTVTDGTTIFTLDAGFRPSDAEILLVATETGTCRIRVGTDGTVKVYGFGTGGAYISFGGASFRAA